MAKKNSPVGVIEYCVDVIGLYEHPGLGETVPHVDRLKFPQGLAFPGGRRKLVLADGSEIDPKDYIAQGLQTKIVGLEDVIVCAVREYGEETGLKFEYKGHVGFFYSPWRDPRGPKATTVVWGTASGEIRAEPGAVSRVVCVPTRGIKSGVIRVFDHDEIYHFWEKRIYQKGKHKR